MSPSSENPQLTLSGPLVSLAVAAIPEGLPIVVTVTLALGVLRMSKRHAIVKKLPSVETLGSVSVICSDKTGTLGFRMKGATENSRFTYLFGWTGTLTTNVMTVTKAYTVDHGIFDLDRGALTLSPADSRAPMFLIGNLCNHAHSDKGKYRGQATEVALMNVLQQVGLADQRPFFTRKSEVAFSSETKTQSVTGSFTHAQATTGPDSTYLSGALDPVLARCQTYLREDNSTAPLDAGVAKLVASKAVELASLGLRVVAMAYGPDPNALTFAGFQGMMDPPRPGVADAITKLSAGGIHVVMITGDSEETAVAIARQLGIRTTPGNSNHHNYNRIGVLTGKEIDALSQRQLTDRIGGVTVFARTTPRHKMAIIEAYQARGAVVAMTGDGGACLLTSDPPSAAEI